MAATLRAAFVTALVVPAVALAGADAGSRVTLTLNVIGPGTVVASPGTRCAGYLTRIHTCRASYAAGTRVKLTALPRANAKLSSWRGAIGSGPTRTILMTVPRLLTATFVKRPAPPRPPAPHPPAIGTRTNPLPLGAPVDIKFSFSNEQWRLRIVSTQPDATAAVLAENQFNDPPAPGRQFFIVTVAVDYVSGAQAWNPGIRVAGQLMAVGPSNVVYSTFGSTSRCGVIPDDITDKGDLLPSGSMTGNICWQVPSAEVVSLLAFIELDNRPFYMALR
jgi:Divergent InlB B-repeat domain